MKFKQIFYSDWKSYLIEVQGIGNYIVISIILLEENKNDRFYKFSVSDEHFHAGLVAGLTVVVKLSKELGFDLQLKRTI